MKISISIWLGAAACCALGSGAFAYPGGTANYQTDVAPFCAACHSSRSEEVLAGGGEQAVKNLAENKHLALIRAGKDLYAELSPAERAILIEHIRAVDAHSRISIGFPPQVATGETFQVTVQVTGGAGPALGVALVDRAHRWFARPASAAGWTVVGAPTVIGADDRPQSDWISRRPETEGRGITFVNILGVSSDAAADRWAKAKVVYTLRAPERAGNYPLAAAFFYGTEKASPLGYKRDALDRKQVRGGFTGGSGRVVFSDVHVITVK